MGATEETLVLLRSMDASLKQLVRAMVTAQPKAIATDRELDGRYGDPILKFQPRDWTGPSYKNSHYSQCPPELLDIVAESNEWFAQKADEAGELSAKGKPIGDYRRLDAKLARGWAKRMRDGVVAAPKPSSNGTGHVDGWDDESGAGNWATDGDL